MTLKPLAILVAALSCAAAPSAFAWYAPTYNTVVTDTTTQLAPSDWLYRYTVDNLTDCHGSCSSTVGGRSVNAYLLGVGTFSVPFFTDAGIIDIAAPAGWAYRVLGTDMFELGFGAGTLQWYATADNAFIARNATLSDFSYHTAYAPGKGPFQVSFGNNDTLVGDPAVPLSPNAIKAGIHSNATPVPEPATGMLMLGALGALFARRRSARKAK
jgi:hypothetical protein